VPYKHHTRQHQWHCQWQQQRQATGTLHTLAHTVLQAVQSTAEELVYEDDDEDATDTPSAAAAASKGRSGAAPQSVSLQELRAALLDADLRKIGSGCLPDDVNRAHSSSIKGPMVLQVQLGGGVLPGWQVSEAAQLGIRQQHTTPQRSIAPHE
jgi:hypothetical protein